MIKVMYSKMSRGESSRRRQTRCEKKERKINAGQGVTCKNVLIHRSPVVLGSKFRAPTRKCKFFPRLCCQCSIKKISSHFPKIVLHFIFPKASKLA